MTASANLLISLLLAASPAEPASNWSGFRNDGASHSAGEHLPLTWSPSQGITWQRELPGYGQSSPIVFQGVVYLTAVVGPHKEKCLLLALDAQDGRERWRIEIAASTGLPSNYAASRAAPTPLVDQRGVYAFFEGGDFVAATHEGRLAWQRSLTRDYGEFNNHHGLGSSPAQTSDSILLNIEHKGPSYLLCLDKATGETRWKIARKSSSSWSSPLVVSRVDRTFAVVSSGGAADVYDAATGESVWSLSDVSGNSIPSPTAHGDHVLLSAALSDFDNAANAARSNLCLKLGPSGQCELIWRAERALCDYASPVVCGDCVFYINRAGVIYCLDRHTSRENYTHRLPGPTWATPIVAGNRLYVFGKGGVTTVIESGPKSIELAKNDLWDSANPPLPETYVETTGGHPHHPGEKSDSATQQSQKSGPSAGSASKGGGFAAALLRNDANSDGKLTADELPPDQQRLLAAGDKNGDQALDSGEIQQMSEEFRKRRENSAHESRDPILYGVAAAGNSFFIRTGTRLYCITR